jgi:hypothetical protein
MRWSDERCTSRQGTQCCRCPPSPQIQGITLDFLAITNSSRAHHTYATRHGGQLPTWHSCDRLVHQIPITHPLPGLLIRCPGLDRNTYFQLLPLCQSIWALGGKWVQCSSLEFRGGCPRGLRARIYHHLYLSLTTTPLLTSSFGVFLLLLSSDASSVFGRFHFSSFSINYLLSLLDDSGHA